MKTLDTMAKAIIKDTSDDITRHLEEGFSEYAEDIADWAIEHQGIRGEHMVTWSRGERPPTPKAKASGLVLTKQYAYSPNPTLERPTKALADAFEAMAPKGDHLDLGLSTITLYVVRTNRLKGWRAWLVSEEDLPQLAEPTEKEAEITVAEGNKLAIYRLTEAAQIRYEGREMGHCVAWNSQSKGSYISRALNGDCAIYSMRKNTTHPLYTFEVVGGRIVQGQGKGRYMDAMTEDEKRVMSVWLEASGISR